MAGAWHFLNHRRRLLPETHGLTALLTWWRRSNTKTSGKHRHALDFDIKTQELRANGRAGRF